jgi:hypothetical protein
MVISSKLKANKKERKRKAEVYDIHWPLMCSITYLLQLSTVIQGMVGVVIFGSIISISIVYGFMIAQPILTKWAKDYLFSSTTISRFHKSDIDLPSFRKFYHQNFPIVFPSIHHENILYNIANQSYCSVDGNTIDEEQPQCVDVSNDFCKVVYEDETTADFASRAEKILCGPKMSIEALSTPRIRSSTMTDVYEDIASFSGPAQFILSTSTYGATDRPIFQQFPQMWEYLMLGRKLWLIYRAGELVTIEFIVSSRCDCDII